MMETTTMTEVEEDCQLLLPDEITSEILSRLPAESVMKCKCVCKTWRALIADPVFIHLYHQKAVVEWATLCNKRTIECRLNCHLHFGEYNDNIINDDDYGKKKIINPFKHSQPVIYRPTTAASHLPRKLNTVCSCNGLIFSMSMLANNMFVCNPLTREYVDLPLPLGFKAGFSSNFLRREIILASGFGYNSYTNEYKIVVIYKHRHACSPGYVTIYTLGSRRWRDKGQISPKLIDGTNLGVFFNGALHWLTEKKEIVSFDLADELFRIVPSPPSSSSQSDHVPQLGLLGGCLCVTRKRSTTLDIWVMDNELQSWTKKFSIAWKLGGNLCADGYRPLALSKSGKLILFHNYFGKPLVSYDPETETSIVDDSFSDFTEIYVLRYIKSYVSLKELGEINADPIYDDGEKSMICESSYSDLMEFDEE